MDTYHKPQPSGAKCFIESYFLPKNTCKLYLSAANKYKLEVERHNLHLFFGRKIFLKKFFAPDGCSIHLIVYKKVNEMLLMSFSHVNF